MSTKRLTLMSLLLAAALIIFIIESAIPIIPPVPGIKMGLANVITLISLVWLGRRDTFVILILRVIIGSFFSGNIMTLAYSMTGAILSYITMLPMLKIIGTKKLWAVSVVGAAAHNTGQIAAAVFITSTWQIIGYLPVLLLSAMVTGVFTGIIATEVVKRKDIKI